MASRTRVGRLVGAVAVGFVLATAVLNRPADPSARLPQRVELEDLILREADRTEALQAEVADLRAELDALRRRSARTAGGRGAEDALAGLEVTAGLRAMEGPGVQVTLDDSSLEESPSGNVNDLVIHSQDVQSVVNALWRAGAEAIAINGQRVVSTSAVLCVGNTLLLNGTVHSPPFVMTAIGAAPAAFEADPLVERFREDAGVFHLGFSVTALAEARVPAYEGTLLPRYARSSS